MFIYFDCYSHVCLLSLLIMFLYNVYTVTVILLYVILKFDFAQLVFLEGRICIDASINELTLLFI